MILRRMGCRQNCPRATAKRLGSSPRSRGLRRSMHGGGIDPGCRPNFSEAVRQLVEIGIEATKNGGKGKPKKEPK